MPYMMKDGQVVLISDEENEAQFTPDIPAVPASVTNFQTRALLIRTKLFDQVNALMQSWKDGTDEQKEAFQAWEYGNDFLRKSPTTAALAQQLKLTDAEVDAMFTEAATIEA